MTFTPPAAKPYTVTDGLTEAEISSAEDLRHKIIALAQQQASLPSWHRPYENGRFYIQHFKQAGGSAYIARAAVYLPSMTGGYDDYQIVVATGTSEDGVLGALTSLELVFEGREQGN